MKNSLKLEGSRTDPVTFCCYFFPWKSRVTSRLTSLVTSLVTDVIKTDVGPSTEAATHVVLLPEQLAVVGRAEPELLLQVLHRDGGVGLSGRGRPR